MEKTNKYSKRSSATALAFEIKDKFIAHREKRLDTESLNKGICYYMGTYHQIILVNGEFHKQMYNIVGKKRIDYMRSVFKSSSNV
jgi:hypothetical protein